MSVGRRTIDLASSWLGRAWSVGVSLSHRAPATPVAARAQCALTKVARYSDTLVWLASGLDARCVKKQCGLVGLCIGGRMTFNLRLSRARTGVVAMRQDSSYYNNWIPQNWGEKGVKLNNKKKEIASSQQYSWDVWRELLS